MGEELRAAASQREKYAKELLRAPHAPTQLERKRASLIMDDGGLNDDRRVPTEKAKVAPSSPPFPCLPPFKTLLPPSLYPSLPAIQSTIRPDTPCARRTQVGIPLLMDGEHLNEVKGMKEEPIEAVEGKSRATAVKHAKGLPGVNVDDWSVDRHGVGASRGRVAALDKPSGDACDDDCGTNRKKRARVWDLSL